MPVVRYSVQMGDRIPASIAVIYKRGAVVDGTQNSVNTVNVHQGHDYEVGHKFLYALTRSNIGYPTSNHSVRRVFTVTSKTATSVTYDGAVFTWVDQSYLVPLGVDTGGALQSDGTYAEPNWDGSTASAYTDPNADESYLYMRVPIEPGGDLGFWSEALDVWIVARDSKGRPVRVFIVSQASGGSGGGAAGSITVDSGVVEDADPGDDAAPGWLVIRNGGEGDKLYIWLKNSDDDYEWVHVIEQP